MNLWLYLPQLAVFICILVLHACPDINRQAEEYAFSTKSRNTVSVQKWPAHKNIDSLTVLRRACSVLLKSNRTKSFRKINTAKAKANHIHTHTCTTQTNTKQCVHTQRNKTLCVLSQRNERNCKPLLFKRN